MTKWTQQWQERMGQCEVVDVRKGQIAWFVTVKTPNRQWVVSFNHCRGFQDIEVRVLNYDEVNGYTRHFLGYINMPHWKMVRVYPQDAPTAVKFFYKTILPYILTHFPKFDD